MHVEPLNDIREHITNGDPCPCMPDTIEDGRVIVHHADDRPPCEIIEQLRAEVERLRASLVALRAVRDAAAAVDVWLMGGSLCGSDKAAERLRAALDAAKEPAATEPCGCIECLQRLQVVRDAAANLLIDAEETTLGLYVGGRNPNMARIPSWRLDELRAALDAAKEG